MTEEKAAVSKGWITWGRGLLIFFVAAWMFVLGILVGRGTAPVKFDTQALQKELAGLRDAMLNKERDAVEKAIRGEDQRVPLDFYEALKKDGPDIADQIPGSQPSAVEAAPPAETADTQNPPRKSRPAIMAKKSTAVVKPAARMAPATSEAPSSAADRLTIQIAALKDAAAAERIVANLKQDGYAAYLSRIVIPDKGLWFRVRVGSYDGREQAAVDMNRLIQDRKHPILVSQ
ncbi:MAG: SPOR domain-containing protein [Desulfosarcina sp.]